MGDGEKSFFAIYGIPDKKNFPEFCVNRFKSLERKGVFTNVTYVEDCGKIVLGRGQRAQSKFKEVFGNDEYLWINFSRLGKINNSNEINLDGFVIRAEILDEGIFEGMIRSSFYFMEKDGKINGSWYDIEENSTTKKSKVKS